MIARVLTPWVSDTTTFAGLTSWHPAVQDVFGVNSVTDVTAQPATSIPPTPNLHVVEVDVSDAVAVAALADATWKHRILWCLNHLDPEMVPTDAQYMARLTALANQLGKTLAQVQAVFGGSTVNGRTLRQIAATVLTWAAGLPKG